MAVLAVTLGSLWDHFWVTLALVLSVPAATGYLLRVSLLDTRESRVTSLGTVAGWTGFLVLFLTQPPFIYEAFVWGFLLFPIGIVIPGALFLGLILGAELAMGALVHRLGQF